MFDKRKRFLVSTLLEVTTALVLAATAAGLIAVLYPL